MEKEQVIYEYEIPLLLIGLGILKDFCFYENVPNKEMLEDTLNLIFKLERLSGIKLSEIYKRRNENEED